MVDTKSVVVSQLESVENVLKVMAVFDENYDGGEFCQGLLLSVETMTMAFALTGFGPQSTPTTSDTAKGSSIQTKLELNSNYLQ